MKIMYCVDNNLGTVGGEQESTKIIIQGMIEKGVDVFVVQPGAYEESMPSSVQSYIVRQDRLKKVFRNPFLFFYYILCVFKIVRNFSPDVIHTQAQVSFFVISLGRMLRIIPRDVAFIHTERGIYTKYNSLFKAFFVFFMRELNCLVCTTEANRLMWMGALSRLNYDLDVKVIYNTAGASYSWASEKSFQSHALKLGFAGRYCNWKNWPLAEELLDRLSSQVPGLQANMAVGCLDEFSLSCTRAMFHRLNCQMGDRFSGIINLPACEMFNFYKDVDIFVLTSWPGTESFGRTVVEAMSSGCIVFVTEGGGPPEVIGDSYFVYKDVEELVQKILAVLADRQLATNISRKNINRAHALYSLDSNIDRHCELYGLES